MKIPKIQIVHNERTRADIAHKIVFKYFIKRYVAVSSKAKENMIKKFGLNSEKSLVINNGVFTAEFGQITKDYKRIKSLYNIGRLTTQKNQLELIDIYKMYHEKCLHNDIKPARLYIVGKGDLLNDIQNKIENLDFCQYIFLVGSTSNIMITYDDCDLLLLPSMWEGLPLVVVEAASSGIPCICYDVGGIYEIIENEVSGILVNAGDKFNFATKLYELTLDYEKREQLGINAKKRCMEIFSIGSCTEKYDKLIRGIT